tara:strand:- start:291 stop:563 length:273 start_codon:yes stop_codon:yes gene_type:complete
MNKFEILEKNNLKHIVLDTGVYLKSEQGLICEFSIEYVVPRETTDEKIKSMNKEYMKEVDIVTEKMISEHGNSIVDLRFLNNMSDKVVFE